MPNQAGKVATGVRLRLLHDAIGEMLRSLELDHRLRAAARSARALLDADASAVMLRDDSGEVLVIKSQDGLSAEYAARQRVPWSVAVAQYRGPDEHLMLDLRQGPLGDRALIEREGLAQVLALPLVFNKELLGSLNVYTKDPARRFGEEDIEVGHILSSATSAGIANARLYAEAVDQRELLRESSEQREQFLSIVSHELRTPLTPLKATAQLLLARIRRHRHEGAPLDLDSLERNLTAIERQVDRMNGLVTDLISVSRAERGVLRMEKVPFDLAALVREVVQRYVTATADEGRHRFRVDAPETLRAAADQSRVEQLLMNLVGNAVKYSPYGGEIAVSLEQADAQARIAISDEGIGIPQEDLARLGYPFVRGAGRAATFAGMGVGLYVARLVAEGHGGTLDIESEGNEKGTTVRVTLPI